MNSKNITFIDQSGHSNSSNSMRRQHLADAAIIALVNYGLRGATFEKIAAIAGVSKGVVLHYYKDKDSIFETVLRRANSMLRDCVIDLQYHANNPWDRLYSIVLGNFSPVVFNKEICSAWLSLCAEAPYNPQCQRIQKAIHSRMRSNLKSTLRYLVNEDELEHTTQCISTVIDGIWLRAGIQAVNISSEEALEEVYFCIDKLISVDSKQAIVKQESLSQMQLVGSIIFKTKLNEMKRRYRSMTLDSNEITD